MDYTTILVETNGEVRLIRLNRPEALNALNSTMMGEIAAAMRAADADPVIRALVVTGSEKAFAAGSDVREMADKTISEVFS